MIHAIAADASWPSAAEGALILARACSCTQGRDLGRWNGPAGNGKEKAYGSIP
jgi:hypothetical protein